MREEIPLGSKAFLCCAKCIGVPVLLFPLPSVRDRVRTKMERDILVEVNHPFIVKLHYGWYRSLCSAPLPSPASRHSCSCSLSLLEGPDYVLATWQNKKRSVNTCYRKVLGSALRVNIFIPDIWQE